MLQDFCPRHEGSPPKLKFSTKQKMDIWWTRICRKVEEWREALETLMKMKERKYDKEVVEVRKLEYVLMCHLTDLGHVEGMRMKTDVPITHSQLFSFSRQNRQEILAIPAGLCSTAECVTLSSRS